MPRVYLLFVIIDSLPEKTPARPLALGAPKAKIAETSLCSKVGEYPCLDVGYPDPGIQDPVAN